MKDIVKVAGVIALAIALKKLAESRTVCVYAGPFRVCNK